VARQPGCYQLLVDYSHFQVHTHHHLVFPLDDHSFELGLGNSSITAVLRLEERILLHRHQTIVFYPHCHHYCINQLAVRILSSLHLHIGHQAEVHILLRLRSFMFEQLGYSVKSTLKLVQEHYK